MRPMKKWLAASSLLRGPGFSSVRTFSAFPVSSRIAEKFEVACGSSGNVTVDLYNVSSPRGRGPLLIYLPPYDPGLSNGVHLQTLPSVFHRYSTAVINYRWSGFDPSLGRGGIEPKEALSQKSENAEEGDFSAPLHWPTPGHDVHHAYRWILDNLIDSLHPRKDIYVFGSYLGASLAAALALTESFPHRRVAVRGLVTYNGIYNWAEFIQDHPVHRTRWNASADVMMDILTSPKDPNFNQLEQHIDSLFGGKMGNLFDPFVSSCIFFRTQGLLVPSSVSALREPSLSPVDEDQLSEEEKALRAMTERPTRQSYLAFPPRSSLLKIPETLLLHSSRPPQLTLGHGKRKIARRKAIFENHFSAQAEELATLMRRSVNMLELKDRMRWDEDFDNWHEEANQRVETQDVGINEAGWELGAGTEDAIGAWLEQRIKYTA